MRKLLVVPAMLAVLAGCGGNKQEKFANLASEFVYTSLSFSPVSATSAGLHKFEKQNLDEMLDDLSSSNLDRQRRFYRRFQQRLTDFKPEELDPENRVDYAIIRDQLSLALLELDEIQSPLHNPTLYVETLGNALFNPYVLEYAPKPQRMRHIIARLRSVPLFLDQASTNLLSAPSVWTRVALEENEGNINLVEKTLRAGAPEEMRAEYDRAAQPALAAMRKFQEYLKNSLIPRDNHDWRLGGSRYVRKFRYSLATGQEPDSVLAAAEKELDAARARMLELALPLHRGMFPAHGAHEDASGPDRINKVVFEVLDRIAERHSTPASYMEDARRDLAQARSFVAEKRLLTLPARSNLQVIETPEFMRGIYAVGGFNPAPALEPQLGAFYWVTPIPPDWPAQRVESKLREYNFYKLMLLTVHEAMPGHYVQFEYANNVQPAARRVLRAVFGNGPYIEGWAQYATQAMLDAGFMGRAPEMQLTFAKEELRVLANAILDIRLHMLNMTDQEALDLMQKQTFQESEEAAAKLQRAKLSSCQLPMYYTGWRGWNALRDRYRAAQGANYKPAEFHDRALKEGAVPLPLLGSLLAGR